MKALFLIDNYSLGGAQAILKGIVGHGIPGCDVFSYALREKKPIMPIQSARAMGYKGTSKYSIRPLFQVIRICREQNIDILHCQLPRSIIFGYLIKRFFLRKIKFIVHEQGDVFEAGLYPFLLRRLAKKADGLIACSGATKNKVVERTGIMFGKVKVIYNFADLSRFKPVGDKSTKGYVIGFAGRLVKRKGWKEFVQAAFLLKKHKDLLFLMAGSGTDEKELQSYIQRYKPGNLIFMGYQEKPEDFYRQLDVLVVPSYFEPMGMVAAEAMACGLPVIASDVPGLNEVVRHQRNGLLIRAGSTDELTAAIETFILWDNHQRDRIKTNNLNDAAKFSYDVFCNYLHGYYSNLLERDGK